MKQTPRQDLTPLAVSALALLCEGDLHPYEICRLLEERHSGQIPTVRPGSLYHAVDRLSADGLVEAVTTDRCGRRPERTIYRITDAGRAALTEAVTAHLREPLRECAWFPVAIGQAHNLSADAARQALTERLADLSERISALEQQVDRLAADDVPQRYWLTAPYLLTMARAEAGWIQSVQADIASGAIAWPAAQSACGEVWGAGDGYAASAPADRRQADPDVAGVP